MRTLPKRLLLAPIALLIGGSLAAILALSAGRWDLPFFWAYGAVYAVLAIAAFVMLDWGLIRERMRSGLRERNTLIRGARVAMLAHLVVAGVDVGRYHWSDAIPIPLQILGLVGFAAGFSVSVWAMAVNRFFVPTVRIQTERGHHVVSSGPYACVRHPGYAGIILGVLSSGLALGSFLALIPMVCLAGGVLGRVLIEDRFLAEHLDGYSEYMGAVPYRLLPRVW
ncbi:MAG: isoprenylcysteine carboxylmethyltransferase family protein [Planctomycetota bacterium]